MATHQGHDAMADSASCASTHAQCCDPDSVNLDGRSGQLKIKSFVELPVVIASDLADPVCVVNRYAHGLTEPPPLADELPPLHVLYCVYLK